MALFIGCGEKESEEPHDLMSDGTIYYEYLERYYHVDDIESFNKKSVSGVVGTDTTWVCGVKNGKRWFGLFDQHSKKQLQEWVGTETISNVESALKFNSYNMIQLNSGYAFMASEKDPDSYDYNFNRYCYLKANHQLVEIELEKGKHYNSPITLYGNDRIFLGDEYTKRSILLSLEGDVYANEVVCNSYLNKGMTFMTGFRNAKVWFALYDNQNNFIQEWEGTDDFNRNIKHHLGYGEYEEYKVNYISISDELSLKTDFGYVFIPTYETSTGESKASDDVFLLNEGKVYFYSLMQGWSSKLRNWYNGSILVNGKVVLSPEGKLIATIKRVVADDEIPISYTETIRFQGYQFDRCNLETGELVWSSSIDRLYNTQSDAKITMTIIDKKNQVWKYRCDIVNKDGSQEQFSLQIDIETGKFTYL